MSADKRTVATDALETLGTAPLRDTEKRDAIHLAVDPVVAGQRLSPGAHITVTNGVAWLTPTGQGIGIVDPFLDSMVEPGDRFWLVVYPRKITSLRHVWTHPDLPESDVLPQ